MFMFEQTIHLRVVIAPQQIIGIGPNITNIGPNLGGLNYMYLHKKIGIMYLSSLFCVEKHFCCY